MSDNSISLCDKATCTVFLITTLCFLMFTNRTYALLCGSSTSDVLLFASTYNLRATSGTPIMKKTIIVRIGILNTNRERPKQSVPIPSIESQRVVLSIHLITYCEDIP